MMEVSPMDELSVWGYKNMIYGLHVEKGHGYLRLQNQDYFVNGWIDVGDSVIRKITDDMLLTVPEGTHTVTVSHKGSSATQEITFARNERRWHGIWEKSRLRSSRRDSDFYAQSGHCKGVD